MNQQLIQEIIKSASTLQSELNEFKKRIEYFYFGISDRDIDDLLNQEAKNKKYV